MKISTVALLGVMALGTASVADAAILFDNPAELNASGNETTQWIQASTFEIGVAADIAGGTAAIASTSGNLSNWDGTFDYFFYAGGASTPGATLASGAATVNSVVDSGVEWGSGGNYFTVDFTLDSVFSALAATEYWFGIHLSTNFDRDEIYWVRSPNGSGVGAEDDGGVGVWRDGFVQKAFTLRGDVGVVPVPAAGVLLLSAMGGLFALRRRRAA
jgi:hypothetical protein